MAKRSFITLCLIRCGETTWDAQGRVHGSTDLPLSDGGRNAVELDAARMHKGSASIVHHAPDEGATVTATICAQAMGAKPRAMAELADPNLGLLEGLTQQEFAERFRSRHKQWMDDPIGLMPPEGEDMPAAADRIFRAVARIIRRSRGEEVAIVLHDLGLAMLRSWIADRPLGTMREMFTPGPAIERVIVPLAMIDELEDAAKNVVGAHEV